MMKRIVITVVVIGIFIAAGLVFRSCKSAGSDADSANTEEFMNALTTEEQEQGWILMFNGETTNGWRGYNKITFPDSGWVVEDGSLKCLDRETGGGGGDIIYDRKFKDFDLKFEWKIDTAGNSGVFYLAQEIPGEAIWVSGLEMQILDNERHPDSEQGKDGNRKAGSLYDLIPAIPQNAKPALEWNTAEIRVSQGTVTHFMNGVQVVDYQIGTPEWDEMVSQSKFNVLPEFAKYQEGYIGLQDHGNNVWYRNMKILSL